jgi:gluconolactonase
MTQELRQVAAGLGALEGPVWTRRGSLVVTSLSRGLLYEIGDGEPQLLAETGGGPNGLAEGPDGSIWVAQNGGKPMASRSPRQVTPSIQRLRNGVVEDLITVGLDAPNDCVFAPDGRLWFTDPRGGLGSDGDGDGPVPGRVCALDTAALRVEVLADGPLYPNGLAFGPDPDDFYLAESSTGRVLHARRTSDGIGEFAVFAQLPEGAPDGLAFDRRGNLLVAGGRANAIFVFDPGGVLIDTIEISPAEAVMVTNLCFGGDDGETLFITVFKGGRVLACQWLQ